MSDRQPSPMVALSLRREHRESCAFQNSLGDAESKTKEVGTRTNRDSETEFVHLVNTRCPPNPSPAFNRCVAGLAVASRPSVYYIPQAITARDPW